MCPQKTQVWQKIIIQTTVKGITVTGTTFTGIIVTGITDLKYHKIVANVQRYKSHITDTHTAITSNKI